MNNYNEFLDERKNILKSIFKGKSQHWIEQNISYHYFKKLYILNDERLKKIIEGLSNKIHEKNILRLLFLMEYSYIPIPVITDFFPNVVLPSISLEQRGLVKYYIFQQKNNIFISFRGTKTLWETINALKFYRVKFNLLPSSDKKDFFKWRDNIINDKNFNKLKTPLITDNDIEIHKGFLDEANLIYNDVVEKVSLMLNPSCKNSNIVLCGHSLGGVLATIVGLYLSYYLKKAVDKNRLKISLITANMPPIGNKNFNLLIPYLKIQNYIRIYNYQDFIPHYGYFGTWIESKKFRHLDFMIRNGVNGEEDMEGRSINTKICDTKIWVKDYGKNLDEFLINKIQIKSNINKKYIFHDFFSVIKKNKILFV